MQCYSFVKSLHWLPVQFRMKYKICTLTYKVIHKCQPVYLHNLLKPLNRTRLLRSSDDGQLAVPRVISKMGERAFSVAAPRLWNCIPLENKKSKSTVISEKNENFIFRPSFSILNPGYTNWNDKRQMITSLIRISGPRGFRRIRTFSFHFFTTLY